MNIFFLFLFSKIKIYEKYVEVKLIKISAVIFLFLFVCIYIYIYIYLFFYPVCFIQKIYSVIYNNISKNISKQWYKHIKILKNFCYFSSSYPKYKFITGYFLANNGTNKSFEVIFLYMIYFFIFYLFLCFIFLSFLLYIKDLLSNL